MSSAKAPDQFTRLSHFLFDKNTHLHVVDQFYRPDRYFPPHKDQISKISIVLNGQLKESIAGKEVYAGNASLVIKPRTIKHANLFGPKGTRVISILVKDDYWQENDLNGILQNIQWFHQLHHAKAALLFVRELHAAPTAQGLEENFIELLAALEDSAPDSAPPPPWLALVKERLADEFETPPSLKTLAQWVDLHPVYLARVFRKYYRCSIKEFIRTLRVQRAIGELSSSRTPLVQIAMDIGYADQSHFTRQFKGEMGISPGAFRKLFHHPRWRWS